MRSTILATAAVLVLAIGGCGRGVSSVSAPENIADNAEFQEAAQRARDAWPDFMAAWEKYQRKRLFQVKHAYESEVGGLVYVWIGVQRVGSARIAGILVSTPEFPIGLDEGDEVTVNISDIVDWLISDIDGNVTGDYTTEIHNKLLAKSRG